MNFKLAWDVLKNGLPKQTETVKHTVRVSRLEMVQAEYPQQIIDSVLHEIVVNLAREAAKRIVVTKERNPMTECYDYTGSLQLGKKGGKYAISKG